MSPTVQGVCTDCWGSKGGRQFWPRTEGSPPLRFSPFVLGASLAAVPAVIILLVWILA